MQIQRLIWSKLRQVRTLVEVVVKNGLTLRDLAQPKENNIETAINSTTWLNYVDLQEPTYVKVTHKKKSTSKARQHPASPNSRGLTPIE